MSGYEFGPVLAICVDHGIGGYYVHRSESAQVTDKAGRPLGMVLTTDDLGILPAFTAPVPVALWGHLVFAHTPRHPAASEEL